MRNVPTSLEESGIVRRHDSDISIRSPIHLPVICQRHYRCSRRMRGVAKSSMG